MKDYATIILQVVVVPIVFLGLTSAGQSQSPSPPAQSDTARLRGGNPFTWNVLPELPPRGFYAHCETPAGVCVVQGSAPIAPGSSCHCGDYPGKTV